jgi:hypothetical protein
VNKSLKSSFLAVGNLEIVPEENETHYNMESPSLSPKASLGNDMLRITHLQNSTQIIEFDA